VVAAKDIGKVVGKVGEVEHLDRAGNQRVAGGFEGDDSWVGRVIFDVGGLSTSASWELMNERSAN